jgi:hypothetical protein
MAEFKVSIEPVKSGSGCWTVIGITLFILGILSILGVLK